MNRRIFAGIVLFALLCAMLTGCGGREKVDLNGAASLADLRGATLGAQTGTFHLQALEQVDGVTKKDYADFTDLLNALRSGAIDGYVAEEPTALEVCGKDDTLTYLPFRNNENGFTATDEETGIAAAFRAIAQKAGLECVLVRGTYASKEHAWNAVKIGETWYYVDASRADSAWTPGHAD